MGGSSPHDVFKALGPAEWGKDFVADAGGDDETLRDFMFSTFSEAQCIIDSIPVGTGLAAGAASTTTTGRPRAATDSRAVPPPIGAAASLPGRAPRTSDHAKALRKDWKEVKVSPSENPLGINVYKMSGKDGKGAWFARRSLHEGLSFERWKLGMEREFAETMKVKKDPGSGNIRGIGAERCVENTILDGCGKAKVYQLSAQFPGPTTPRDFVTLMLTSDCAIETPVKPGQKQARYFMVVSKPCVHPKCPQRSGFIRGYYESVEFIREIKVDKPLRRTQSSIDISRDEVPHLAAEAAKAALNKDAMGRPPRQGHLQVSGSDGSGESDGRGRGKTIAFAGVEGGDEAAEEDDGQDTMIEWLMVTRSDPGGSVPRFMVEKGTPGGIAGDANKFLKWVSSKKIEDFDETDENDTKLKTEAREAEEKARRKEKTPNDPTSNILDDPVTKSKPKLSQTTAAAYTRTDSDYGEDKPEPYGFYGVLSNALGVVGAVASLVPNPFGSAKGGDTDLESTLASETSDDTSSMYSFHSLDPGDDDEPLEGHRRTGAGPNGSNTNLTRTVTGSEGLSVHSSESAELSIMAGSTAGSTMMNGSGSGSKRNSIMVASQHEKELRRLEDRKRKMEEKHKRDLARRADDSTKDESAIAKLREKHEKEKQRQEEKYQREIRKLEARREAEQKKADRRRQKAMEKQEKYDMGMELEKAKAERDVALKQIEMLKEQVGDLQSQNTLLVARLGREGIKIDMSSRKAGIEGIFSDLTTGRRPAGSRPASMFNGRGGEVNPPGVLQVDGPACLREPVRVGEV